MLLAYAEVLRLSLHKLGDRVQLTRAMIVGHATMCVMWGVVALSAAADHSRVFAGEVFGFAVVILRVSFLLSLYWVFIYAVQPRH